LTHGAVAAAVAIAISLINIRVRENIDVGATAGEVTVRK